MVVPMRDIPRRVLPVSLVMIGIATSLALSTMTFFKRVTKASLSSQRVHGEKRRLVAFFGSFWGESKVEYGCFPMINSDILISSLLCIFVFIADHGRKRAAVL